MHTVQFSFYILQHGSSLTYILTWNGWKKRLFRLFQLLAKGGKKRDPGGGRFFLLFLSEKQDRKHYCQMLIFTCILHVTWMNPRTGSDEADERDRGPDGRNKSASGGVAVFAISPSPTSLIHYPVQYIHGQHCTLQAEACPSPSCEDVSVRDFLSLFPFSF